MGGRKGLCPAARAAVGASMVVEIVLLVIAIVVVEVVLVTVEVVVVWRTKRKEVRWGFGSGLAARWLVAWEESGRQK